LIEAENLLHLPPKDFKVGFNIVQFFANRH